MIMIFFLILYDEMCQQLEDRRNSVNLYFPNDHCMMFESHHE